MTGRVLRSFVSGVVLAAALAAFQLPVQADIDGASATNVQEGDNSTSTDQDGEASSGDAVAGQVTGVVSSGDVSVDATNSSVGASASSGSAAGENDSASFTGLNVATDTDVSSISDITGASATNIQEGDNDTTIEQSASALGGDGVAGQVIGVVSSGSTDIVASNISDGADGSGGGAAAFNESASFVGLNVATDTDIDSSDVADATATNLQEGDNEFDSGQVAESVGGDGIGGQVLGVVSAGDTSIDATNDSSGAGGSGGGATADNAVSSFVGLNVSTDTDIFAADVDDATATNVQSGDNSHALSQVAQATGGDGVAGQVAGVVTSAGGSADLVLANTTDSSATSGGASFFNTDESFTGLNAGSFIDV